jgi:hypothetical protein
VRGGRHGGPRRIARTGMGRPVRGGADRGGAGGDRAPSRTRLNKGFSALEEGVFEGGFPDTACVD